MLPRKIFKNVHAAMAILVLFKKFSAKFCLNFLTLILNASPNMMHFVRTFSIMRAYGVRLIATKEARHHRKINCIGLHQKYFPKWLVGGGIPLNLPPGSAPSHKLQKT